MNATNDNKMSNANTWSTVMAAATVRKRKANIAPDHPKRVLFCLDLTNPFRKLCIKFVEWK